MDSGSGGQPAAKTRAERAVARASALLAAASRAVAMESIHPARSAKVVCRARGGRSIVKADNRPFEMRGMDEAESLANLLIIGRKEVRLISEER